MQPVRMLRVSKACERESTLSTLCVSIGLIASRKKISKISVVRRKKWKTLTVSRKRIPIHNLHFRDCQDHLFGLFASFLVADHDVPYFSLFSSGKGR